MSLVAPWPCEACTFSNHPSMPICSMCETARVEASASGCGGGGCAHDYIGTRRTVSDPSANLAAILQFKYDAELARMMAAEQRDQGNASDAAIAAALAAEDSAAATRADSAADESSAAALAVATAAEASEAAARSERFVEGVFTVGGQKLVRFCCPHCRQATEVLFSQVNCTIFICGVVIATGRQVPQHNEANARRLRAEGKIVGCAKQYRLVKVDHEDGTHSYRAEPCTGR